MVRSWSGSDIVGNTPGNLVPLEFGGLSLLLFQERLGWVRVERTAPSRRVEQCSCGAPALCPPCLGSGDQGILSMNPPG